MSWLKRENVTYVMDPFNTLIYHDKHTDFIALFVNKHRYFAK